MGTAPAGHAKYLYIDCVRGYAILLVIACHVTRAYPELPTLVMRQTSFGWHGVQLFFLASCLTLMMSWASDVAKSRRDVGAFFLRRLFRIAPAYYVAALAYYFLFPPAEFDWTQLAFVLGFINGWTPRTMPTVAGQWGVVPGGWSIAVEMMFYLLLPVIASVITNLRRSLVFVAVSVGVALVSNIAFLQIWAAEYSDAAVSNFLYFWLPNQLPIFALGTVVYHLIVRANGPQPGRVLTACRRRGNLLAAICVVLFAATAHVPLAKYWGEEPIFIPSLFVVAIWFAGFVFGVSSIKPRFFVNRWVGAVGEVSFSCYLVHWALLHLLFQNFPDLLGTSAKRYASLPAYVLGFIVTAALTVAISWVTYRLIERPMIALAKRLTAHRSHVPQPTAPTHGSD